MDIIKEQRRETKICCLKGIRIKTRTGEHMAIRMNYNINFKDNND